MAQKERIDRRSIEYLKDTFEISRSAYESSVDEGTLITDYYHDRQWTGEQLNILERRGQPPETFNIIKSFARLLIGYYSTTINHMQAQPVGMEDVITTSVINDVIDYTLRNNNFVEEGEKTKLEGLLTGLMCVFVDVKATGEVDEFGRPLNKVVLEFVNSKEMLLDPKSRRDDYDDARFQHRFKWLTEEAMLSTFGSDVFDKMEAFYNFTNRPSADYEGTGDQSSSTGIFRIHESYLVVHTIVVDENGKSWSIFWNDDFKLKEFEITHKGVKFPYRCVKIHTSTEPDEYYGIFREILATQNAINQALVKFQQLVNSQKVFYEEGAVTDGTDFVDMVNRVTAVIPVLSVEKIKVVNLTAQAIEQYAVIDKALERVQRVLGINDSFLGMAFASDSGRKVKLQQNASIIALRYFTGRVETLYRFLGWDIVNLLKQYLTAHQILRITDDYSGLRWAEINKPEMLFKGNVDENGEPILEFEYEYVEDPASGENLVDDEGRFIIAPVPTAESEIAYTKVDMEIITTSYNDEDEKTQIFFESFLQGTTGKLLAQANPSNFFKAASLGMQSMKTKFAPEVSKLLSDTADQLSGDPQQSQEISESAQGTSQATRGKLPENNSQG